MPTTSNKYITGEQLIKGVHKRIDKLSDKKKQVITEKDIANGITGKELIEAVCARIDKFADKK